MLMSKKISSEIYSTAITLFRHEFIYNCLYSRSVDHT